MPLPRPLSVWYETARKRWWFAPKVSNKGIVASSTWGSGRQFTPDFATMGERYLSDVHIRYSIDTFAETVVQGGFHFVTEPADSSQTVKEPSKDAKEAIRVLDGFCDRIDMDTWILDEVRDLWGLGNIFAELQDRNDIENLARIPTMTVKKSTVTPRGEVISLTQKVGGDERIWNQEDMKDLIHIPWNPFDNSVFGRGVLDNLCRSGVGYTYQKGDNSYATEYRPAMAEAKEEFEDAARKISHRMVPRHVLVLQGIDDARATSINSEWRKLRPEDDFSMSTPGKDKAAVDILKVGMESRTQIDPYMNYFFDAIIMGTQTPEAKLVFGGGQFTEAASRTAERIALRKVNTVRKFLKRKLEKMIFTPILLQNGFTEEQLEEMGIEMRWEPITYADLGISEALSLYQSNAIGRNEVRLFASKAGLELLDNPEYLGIQGGATITDEGATQSGGQGYKKDAKGGAKDEGEKQAQGVK